MIFVDVEVAGSTRIDFVDDTNALIHTRNALAAGNPGLSFVGATVTGGAISRVRITSGLNTIVSNGVLGNPNDDIVVMGDFLYAEPTQRRNAVPEPYSVALISVGLHGVAAARRRVRRTA